MLWKQLMNSEEPDIKNNGGLTMIKVKIGEASFRETIGFNWMGPSHQFYFFTETGKYVFLS